MYQPLPMTSPIHPNAGITRRTDKYNLYTDGLTQGAIGKWQLCPELFRLSVMERLSLEGSTEALDFGNIAHKNLELTYGTFMYILAESGDTPSLQRILNISSSHLVSQQEAAIKELMATMGSAKGLSMLEVLYGSAEATLKHYFNVWREDFSTVRWTSLELEFEIPYRLEISDVLANCIPDAFIRGKAYEAEPYVEIPIRGKIDGVMRDENDRLWLVDHKTKRSIDGDAIIQRLPLDMQVGVYIWAAESIIGQPIDGVLYNLIRRPSLRQRVTEPNAAFIQRIDDDIDANIPTYYKRGYVEIGQADRQRFREEFGQILTAFHNWYSGGPHYRNSAACDNGMWACKFLRGCGIGEWEAFDEREHIYPELVADLQPA